MVDGDVACEDERAFPTTPTPQFRIAPQTASRVRRSLYARVLHDARKVHSAVGCGNALFRARRGCKWDVVSGGRIRTVCAHTWMEDIVVCTTSWTYRVR